MTIGIAAVCERGGAVVLCADRGREHALLGAMVDGCPKIQEVGRGLIICAGSHTLGNRLVRGANVTVDHKIRTVADLVRRSFEQLAGEEAESKVLSPYGLSMQDLVEGRGITPELASKLADRVETHEVNLDCLLAGKDEEGVFLVNMFQRSGGGIAVEEIDIPGYAVVGCADRLALASLMRGGTIFDKHLNQAVWAVYEAKRQAELDPHVMPETDITIIRKGEYRYLSPAEMSYLAGLYEGTVDEDRSRRQAAMETIQL